MFFYNHPDLLANFPKSNFFLVSLKKPSKPFKVSQKHNSSLPWMLWSFLLTTPYLQPSKQREKTKHNQPWGLATCAMLEGTVVCHEGFVQVEGSNNKLASFQWLNWNWKQKKQNELVQKTIKLDHIPRGAGIKYNMFPKPPPRKFPRNFNVGLLSKVFCLDSFVAHKNHAIFWVFFS